MGMYGDILNKLDDSLFIKIEPGKPANVRLLDHPWISQKQFVDKVTGEARIATQFSWPVWDYNQQRIRVMSQGKSVFKQIAAATDTWPRGEDMPSPFDLIIKRTGTGQFDTEYTVSAIPHQGTMPRISPDQLPDMAEKSGGIPIRQVLDGKRAPVIAAGGPPVSLPEPKRPTHTDAEALDSNPVDNREPEGNDTIITDLDSDNPINLDEIPFDTDGEGR